MYFDKGNYKKNRKITFPITLAILLVATVAISTTVITKNAFAADPITSCFAAEAVINPAYFQSEQNFVNSLPNDQELTNLATAVKLSPVQNNQQLFDLLTNPGLTSAQQNQGESEIANLLTAAGFNEATKEGLMGCITGVIKLNP
jgi:hypothetical protein